MGGGGWGGEQDELSLAFRRLALQRGAATACAYRSTERKPIPEIELPEKEATLLADVPYLARWWGRQKGNSRKAILDAAAGMVET